MIENKEEIIQYLAAIISELREMMMRQGISKGKANNMLNEMLVSAFIEAGGLND